ncbi:VWA domain-containing protein [Cocleimonas sp. KMM 6892]|uniref:nitric oxide reductase activation protein NorD n=1 Tax=unclassified Cocleimonas TaxID=2639732 RepID=UPI002DBF97B5|nr:MULTISPECIES: VWA domain-containing protein [unclassified Cocleimonas]MEB8430648.1 VWA domain-containing protein [Cocleimonas sp. KMM 6892]MEC4716901.1 VWA domain-containing protein [Cocleimonas sp. KMM 6895]MEC4743913.1 VWA domain-containing protein [Cocleimonas sp. KMM 6896]
MLEEFVGETWHKFITKRADKSYPEAVVHLDEVRRTAGIFFRALGGEGGLRVENATDSEVHAKRTILQRIAGIGDKTQYAWRDEETLRLPDSIALFPTRQLNLDLYLWLTALSVIDSNNATAKDWISRNQYCTLSTLAIWPGLKPRYHNLLQAHLQQRPDPKHLSKGEANQETAIQNALMDSDKAVQLQYAKRPPQPVPLWLHPSPPEEEFSNSIPPQDPDFDEAAQSKEQKKNQEKQQKRKQGNRTEMPDGNSGLMSFRLESLWSWAEYSKVDRTSTEDDDDNAMRTAEDMDNITVAQDSKTTSSKIKLDLDLPSSNYDDIVLGEGLPIDEWDYKQQRMQKDHCRLQTMVSRDAIPTELPERLRAQAHKVRRQFEVLKPQRVWKNRQNDGTELDLENYVNYLTDRRHGHVQSDTPVYRELRNQNRDLSCLLLADLSLSTDAHINNDSRVIDVIRDSLYLFSEALHATGDRFALHGFSSRNRNHVRFYNIKDFDENYNDEVRGHIDAVRPGYYTRMGAAIRHATEQLSKQATSQKLLLILTDGKPNDLDKYEGRYGIEDTRMAVLEAEKLGVRPFCVTIDEQAEDYLPYLFGSRSFVLIRNAAELPKKLPLLYLRLTKN